jgi:hypothetical protein
MNARRKKILPLIFLLIVFVVPMLISGYLYVYHDRFQFKTTNHGTLLNPPIEISTDDSLRKWRIIYITGENCDDACKKIVTSLHQVKKALGKNSDRVLIETRAMLAEQATQQIYLVDPANRLFMFYPGQVDPMYILKDMKRVLEVSHIG